MQTSFDHRQPTASRARRFGKAVGCAAAGLLAVLLCLGGCAPADAPATAQQTWEQVVRGVARVDGALDALDAGSAVQEGAATASRGLRHEVSCRLMPATVERVVDGDTLKLQVDGESTRVRLIGINTPESVAPEGERNTEEGADASAFVKDYLHEGQQVWLMFDQEPYDRYGRMLAYVWTEVPGDFTDPAEVRTKMLNAHIADQGYAVVHAYEPNDAYCDLLHGFADDAEAQGRGLWAVSDDWGRGI